MTITYPVMVTFTIPRRQVSAIRNLMRFSEQIATQIDWQFPMAMVSCQTETTVDGFVKQLDESKHGYERNMMHIRQ